MLVNFYQFRQMVYLYIYIYVSHAHDVSPRHRQYHDTPLTSPLARGHLPAPSLPSLRSLISPTLDLPLMWDRDNRMNCDHDADTRQEEIGKTEGRSYV